MFCLLVALVVLASPALFAAPPAPSSGGPTARLGVSPHGQPGACAACHDPTAGAAPGAVRPVDATCRSCHPDADMHPVGMEPQAIAIAPGFPLEAGVMTCATCHAEPSCDRAREGIAPFLRGGNPDRKVDFCNRCHEPARLERTDPHHPGEASADDPTCAACHNGAPAPAAPPALARLMLSPADACVTCHPGPVHAGAAEHVGAVQPALAGELAEALPLDAGNRIACWTCHDVHAHDPTAPVPPSRLTVALRRAAPPPTTDHPSLLALPAADGTLCRACHGKGP
ncbi:MAG: cytochrome c3 family protein [Pseudomonadota bacterium]|nr:cytochrome c3 family protein [Pseudomonadota bacterium]